MDFFSNPKKNAHPKAIDLMKEEFFWSPIDEAGPFGSDSGSDAAAGFDEWRKVNKSANPVDYLRELLSDWGFPVFDWNELDPDKIKEYINTPGNTDDMAGQIAMMKEAFSNMPDNTGAGLTDEYLQEMVLQASRGMGGTYLLNSDNAIIGTGFAQFAMEGKIDNDLQYLTHTALKRQLLPVLIDRYDVKYKEIRKQMLLKMMEVVEKANMQQ